MNRHASIRALSFFLVVGCGAFCQNPPSLQGLQFDSPNSPEMQRLEIRTWKSLPDAPSPQPPAQAEGFHTFGNDRAGVLPGFCLSNCGYGYLPRKAPDFLEQTPLDQERLNETERGYVTPRPRHVPSAGGSFIGRASSAASSIIAMPGGSGKGQRNSSDFLGVLTSVATSTAYRTGRDPLLRLSKSLVRPLAATRASTSSTRFGLAFGKK